MESTSTLADGMLLQHCRRRLDAARTRHDDVHEDDIGFQRPGAKDRFLEVAGLADDLDVFLRVEQELEPAAHDGVVVDYHDSDLAQTGTSARRVVPLMWLDSIVSRPPSS